MPGLLVLVSQKKKKKKKKLLGIISMLVYNILVLLYFLIFIMVLVLVFEYLKEQPDISFWGERKIIFNGNIFRSITEWKVQGPGSNKKYKLMQQTLTL